MNIGIIGGGIAGLTTAYELGKQGHKVHLFERYPELGGQAGTFEVAGERLERFYHHIFGSDADIIQLIDELGLSDRLEWLNSKVGFFHGGKVYDFVTPVELLKFSPISFVDRIRLGLITVYLRRYKNWRALEVVTAREWLLKYGGKRSYDVVWGPMLRNKFGAGADEVGMVWLWGKIHLRLSSRKGGKEQLGYMKGSYGVLIDALAEKVVDSGGQISASTPVEKIVVEDGKATGLHASGQVYSFDLIVATVPSSIFLSIIPELPSDYTKKLADVRYQGALVLAMTLKQPLTHIYWMNISDPEIPFIALVEHTNFVAPSVYSGKRILYVSNYLSPESPLYSLDKEELLAHYLPHIQKFNPDFGRDWIEELFLFRDDAGQPIIGMNYSSRVPELRTPIVNLYLANTTQIYPEDRGMNYSVRLGQEVAKLIIDQG
jgi:protoporphyrinogen oxidase